MRAFVKVLLLIFLVLLGCIITGEQTISLSEFKNELNKSGSISVVMDTRSSPSAGVVMQCGVDIAQTLGMIGKYEAVKNKTFVYEDDRCVYWNKTSSINECESLISGSTVFYVQYNSTKNSTFFYKSKAVIEGDVSFLTDCAIARIIK
jgi:hypothetical protein